MKDLIEKTYSEINNWVTNTAETDLIDTVCPAHDGAFDAERVAELMRLRQDAYSLRVACQQAIDKLDRVIELAEGNIK